MELIRVRQEERQRFQEELCITQREAAAMMLMSRGCPQSVESLGVLESLRRIESRIGQAREWLSELEVAYIAPPGSEVHTYNVKRPYKTYYYNKLTAESAIFEPSEKQEKVRVIHLSHNDDARHLEARAGIERRNKLLRLVTQLAHAEQHLEAVLAEALECENYSATGDLYFIYEASTNHIKIGRSGNVNQRLQSLQSGNPGNLVLLKVIKGNGYKEREVHRNFHEIRVKNEWFRATPELLDYIEGLSDES